MLAALTFARDLRWDLGMGDMSFQVGCLASVFGEEGKGKLLNCPCI